MSKITLKCILIFTMLLVGMGSSWADGNLRTLASQDYSSFTTGSVTASSSGYTTYLTDWYVAKGVGAKVSNTTTYGNYAQCYNGNGSTRTAYKSQNLAYTAGTGFSDAAMTTLGYNVEFDFLLVGSTINSTYTATTASQFKVAGSDPSQYSATSTDYLFALTQPSGLSTQSNTWYINDLNNTANPVTLGTSTWYHLALTVTASKVSYVLSENNSDGTIKQQVTNGSGSLDVTSMPTIAGFYDLLGGNKTGKMNFDNLKVYDYVAEVPADNPVITLTKVDGTSRTYHIAFTEGQTLYYELPGESSFTAVTTGSSVDVTTSTTGTLTAYTMNGTAKSSDITETVDATDVTLNAPAITVSNLATSGDARYATYTAATTDQSSVLLSPSASYSATFTPTGGTEKSVDLPYAATENGTITVTAACDGYTSSTSSLDVTPFAKLQMVDYTASDFDVTNYTLVSGTTAWNGVSGMNTQVYTPKSTGATSGITLATTDRYQFGLGIGLKNIHTANSWLKVAYSGIVSFEVADDTNSNETENFFYTNASSSYDYYNQGYILHKVNQYVPLASSTPSTVTVAAGKNFATYTPVDNAVIFPEGDQTIKAYKAVYTSGSSITMKRIYTAAVGQGVILARTDQTSNTNAVSANVYTLASSVSVSNPSDNALVGVTTALTAQQMIDAQSSSSKTPYVLSNGIWYQVDATKSTDNIPVGKAYLAINMGNAANAIQMNFGDVATGINEVSAAKTGDNKIYNLQGMEVKNTEKGGLYIMNGKKVVF